MTVLTSFQGHSYVFFSRYMEHFVNKITSLTISLRDVGTNERTLEIPYTVSSLKVIASVSEYDGAHY